jgi:drug/metabolite transporter (DMT)-like permease
VIVAGIVLSATHDDDASGPGAVSRADARHAAIFAVGAALAFGVSLYGTGRLSADLPIAWLVLPARITGVLAVALPLLAAGRLTMTRRAAPLVVAAGLCEVLGFVSFALGARDGIAVAAVLASQFAAIAAIAAFVLFGERLARIQVAGVAAIVAGVAVLSALQA